MSASHHNPEQAQKDAERLNRFIEEVTGTAKRKWPNGRVSGEDDGETAFAIAADHQRKIVIIKFSKPMDWIGFGEEEARQLAAKLLEKADELKGVPR